MIRPGSETFWLKVIFSFPFSPPLFWSRPKTFFSYYQNNTKYDLKQNNTKHGLFLLSMSLLFMCYKKKDEKIWSSFNFSLIFMWISHDFCYLYGSEKNYSDLTGSESTLLKLRYISSHLSVRDHLNCPKIFIVCSFWLYWNISTSKMVWIFHQNLHILKVFFFRIGSDWNRSWPNLQVLGHVCQQNRLWLQVSTIVFLGED